MDAGRDPRDAVWAWSGTDTDSGNDRHSSGARGRPRSRWIDSAARHLRALVSVSTFVVVSLVGGVAVANYPVTYSTQRTLVVVPSKVVPMDEAASLFDSLSRGQVVATVAAILEQPRWRSETPDVVVTAGSATPSSVIEVSASGRDRAHLAATLDLVVARATTEADGLLTPYKVIPLSEGPSTIEPIGLTLPMRLALVALVAAFATGVVSQVVKRVGEWLQRRKSG